MDPEAPVASIADRFVRGRTDSGSATQSHHPVAVATLCQYARRFPIFRAASSGSWKVVMVYREGRGAAAVHDPKEPVFSHLTQSACQKG